MFTGLALAEIIKVAGSDDKDKEALETSEGQRGTQFNLSALGRWLNGENYEMARRRYCYVFELFGAT